jgi:hypothetical protein
LHEFFHDEDEVGMVQLHPVEWWSYCADQHLLLVDWRRHRLVDLRARDEILAYLEG